jgi:ElaB/YqjD/DUF883 family membrane-anchored ribosome-binding protein
MPHSLLAHALRLSEIEGVTKHSETKLKGEEIMATTSFNPRNKEDKGTPHGDKAKEAAGEALTTTKEAGKEAVTMVKEAGAEALNKATEAGSQAIDKAKDVVGSVGEMAAQTASALGHKADDVTAAAGHGIKEFGDTVARKAPHEGMTGAASQAMASAVQGTGKYLEDAKLSGMAHDVEQVVKNHPIPALLICLGVGFCLGRAIKD